MAIHRGSFGGQLPSAVLIEAVDMLGTRHSNGKLAKLLERRPTIRKILGGGNGSSQQPQVFSDGPTWPAPVFLTACDLHAKPMKPLRARRKDGHDVHLCQVRADSCAARTRSFNLHGTRRPCR